MDKSKSLIRVDERAGECIEPPMPDTLVIKRQTLGLSFENGSTFMKRLINLKGHDKVNLKNYRKGSLFGICSTQDGHVLRDI